MSNEVLDTTRALLGEESSAGGAIYLLLGISRSEQDLMMAIAAATAQSKNGDLRASAAIADAKKDLTELGEIRDECIAKINRLIAKAGGAVVGPA